MQRQHIPGLALGVYLDGKIAKVQGYGLANIEWDAPVKPDTIFQSGSMGKQFLATAVMMLVEEGKIALDDPVREYFPDAPESWTNITVRNLLNHTSGLAEYIDTSRDGPLYLRSDFTENDLYKKISALPMEFKPNERWRYRNTNYVVLGILIHKVTGKFYGDFLQERIFKPIAMANTRIISEEDIIPHRAAGYRLVNGQIKNQEWVSPTFNSTADGALYFTVLDLAKWDATLYTDKLLKKSSFAQMWTPTTLSSGERIPYGFGWHVDVVNGHRLLEHGGVWQGFTTIISRYVDDRVTVVVLTNLDAQHSDPKKIAHEVAGLYDPDLTLAAQKAIPDREPQVTAFLLSTLADLAADQPNLESFALDGRGLWAPERVKGLSERLKSFGALKSIDLLDHVEDTKSRSYTYRATFADQLALVNLTLDSAHQITALQVRPE
jgi:CubicO group peptidase (beta-lactamase class C family)